jgi:hypothetical protein
MVADHRHIPDLLELDALADAHLAVTQAAAGLAEAEAVVAERRHEYGLAMNELSKRISQVVYGPYESVPKSAKHDGIAFPTDEAEPSRG